MSEGSCAFIKLDAVMDVEKAALLEKEFEKLVLHGKKEIYFDFSDVEFLCSYMMRVFLHFHKTYSRLRIKLGIQHFNDYSKDSLKMAGLLNLFTLSPDWQKECNLTGENNTLKC